MTFSNPVTVASAVTDGTNPKVLNYNGVVGRIYLLCLGRYLAADSYTSVVDNAGNTWTRLDYAPKSGTTGRRIEIWMCKPTTAFASVIATQNNTGFGTASLVEIQGGTGVVNVVSAIERAGSTAPAPLNVTPTKANTLVISIIQANANTTSQIHQSAGWTAIGSAAEGPKIVYKYNPPSGSPVGVSWTLDTSSGSGHAIVALEEAPSASWFLWDGTTETPLTLDGEWNGTTITPCVFDTIDTTPPPATDSMRIGMDAPLGLEWSAAVTDYPGIKYTRDFGKDNLYGTDADTWTEPTLYGTGKFVALPSDAMMHISWKDDGALLQNWLDALPDLPADHPGFYVSPFHEPRDEVDAGIITLDWLRTQGETIAQIAASHPKGWLIKGNGPVLTRFDLDEKNVNPADYGYTGMTFFGIDCYMNAVTLSSYYDNTKMFGYVFDRVHAVYPGIKMIVPEYGLAKLNSDSSGNLRATAITNHINYLKSRGDVLAVAYFNDEGSIAGVPFSATSPEAGAWRTLQAAQ